VKKREPYSLNCQQYPKWMLQYKILWLELPLSFVQIFRGKRMLSSFWRVCVSTMII
jgi:hypothetical protein